MSGLLAKYVLYEDTRGIHIIIFDCGLKHSAGVSPGEKVLGAGFIDLETLECSGYSVSLRARSRAEIDKKIIGTLFQHDRT